MNAPKPVARILRGFKAQLQRFVDKLAKAEVGRTAVAFTIYGRPVAKGRPRFWNGHVSTPAATRKWESHVKSSASIALRQFKADCRRRHGPLLLWCTFFMPTLGRVDVDNLAKSIKDGLNGVTWDDDSQVFMLIAEKTLDRDNPRVEVTVMDWEGWPVEEERR